MKNKISDQAEKLRQLAAQEQRPSVDSGNIATLESTEKHDKSPVEQVPPVEESPQKRLLLNPNGLSISTKKDSPIVVQTKDQSASTCIEQQTSHPVTNQSNANETDVKPTVIKQNHKALSIESVIDEATGTIQPGVSQTSSHVTQENEITQKTNNDLSDIEVRANKKDDTTATLLPEVDSIAISLLESKRFPVETKTRVIAITGGKGGVGKSNVTCNLALAMVQMKKRVLILDADLSLANIDVLLGLTPRLNLAHVLRGEKELQEIIITGPGGMQIIPSGSGLEELTNLTSEQMERLFDSFSKLDPMPDILLIDTAAGIHPNVLQFLLAADQTIVVTTPEPTAYTDAYALIKTVAKHNLNLDLGVIINMAQDRREALDVTKLMFQMCRQFLKITFNNLGYIPRDPEVHKAVRRQKALLMHAPHSPAAKQIYYIASTLLQIDYKEKKGLKGFFTRLFTQSEKQD